MKTYNIALIGFGGVNRALAAMIASQNEVWRAQLGFGLNIVAVSDLHHGSVVSPNGIDAAMLSQTKFGKSGFSEISGGHVDPRNELIIKNSNADIVVEATFTNPTDGEPAATHCRWALAAGKHVATSNKGPVVFAGRELKALAARHNVRFECEGAVMSGTPVIRMARDNLRCAGLRGFEGVLNGTSNYILGRMEAGLAFEEALQEAQALGYAEADPTADIAGFDVRLKVIALANELLGGSLEPNLVACEGIAKLGPADISEAAGQNKRWKLVGSARRSADGGIVACVEPRMLPTTEALAGVNGVINAISFQTDLLGAVTVSGPGAGRTETAYALLSDIIAIHEHQGARECEVA